MTACYFVLKGPGITAELPRVFRSLFMHHERQHGSCQEVPRLVTDCKPHISRSFPGKESFPAYFEKGRKEENGGEYARGMAVILGKHANPESSPITAPKKDSNSGLLWLPLPWSPVGPNSPGSAQPHLTRSVNPAPQPAAFRIHFKTAKYNT